MLPNYLANIKSSGLYRFVWDKSEMPGEQAKILRLVVGYSEKGPFNTPVYVTSEPEFKQIFGGISKKMERYGVWFHRLAIQALKAGPILVLNLKNFENCKEGQNQVEYTTFNPANSIFMSDEEGNLINEKLKMTVKDLYNTDRFWKLEPEHLEELQDEGILTKRERGYITITTTDSKETSTTVFMRGYEPAGYDVPIKEWYSAVLNGEDVPSYLEGHENDLVSQYFAEIYIFKGEFTPQVAASDKLAKFFNVNGTEVTLKPYIVNAFGEKIDTLAALAGNDASNFIKSYSGILLPDFRNANNTVISLDAQVNGDNYVHKLMMRLNQDMLYNIITDPDDPDYESQPFKIDMIDTTGWSMGPNIGKNGKKPAPMMSLIDVDPIVYTATFDGTKWVYTPNKEEHAGLAADYYKYEGLQYKEDENNEFAMIFDDESNMFGHTGLKEGDSVYIARKDVEDTPENEEGGKLVHIVKVDSKTETTEGIAEHYTINGEGEYATQEEAEAAIVEVPVEPAYFTVNGEGHYDERPEVEHHEGHEAVPAVTRGTICHDSDITNPGTAVNANYRKVGNYGMVVSGEPEEDTIHTIDGQPTNRFGVAIQIPAEYEEGATWRIGTRELGTVKEEMDTNPSDWARALYLYPAVTENGLSLAGVTGETLQVTVNYADGKSEMFEMAYAGEEDDETIIELGGEPIEPAQDEVPEYWTVNGEGEYETEEAANAAIAEVAEVPGYYTINGEGHYTERPEVEKVDATETVTKTIYTVQYDKEVATGAADYEFYKCMGSVTATSANMKPCYLKGYTFGNDKPKSTRQDDKLAWQHHILDALTLYRGIRLALTNRVDVDYRYLVDTFESFVEFECKSILSNLVMSKDNTLGLLNFPKMSSFSKCPYTSFRNEKNEFLTKYIAMGGNSLKPMARMFSLPSQENGASWVGFFTSLALRDGNTGVREEIPSAALVSNDFMQKFSKFFPYTIIAGPNRGVIREPGLIGPDFNFSREDLDILEPFGVNCMVYEPRKGTYINSNQTAKQNPVTSLSKINVRELCIYIQDEIEKLLTDYHWDFNTPNLRNRIKDRADVILEQVQNNEGVYKYYNQCDDYNNTDDVIDNEMFVLSTSIEPTKGAGKMVQELTIYRKGGMKSMITES